MNGRPRPFVVYLPTTYTHIHYINILLYCIPLKAVGEPPNVYFHRPVINIYRWWVCDYRRNLALPADTNILYCTSKFDFFSFHIIPKVMMRLTTKVFRYRIAVQVAYNISYPVIVVVVDRACILHNIVVRYRV